LTIYKPLLNIIDIYQTAHSKTNISFLHLIDNIFFDLHNHPKYTKIQATIPG
jgi:hypothetical protein